LKTAKKCESFAEFVKDQTPYTKAGDKKTSGNGSLMRLAPAPVSRWSDLKKGKEISKKQSLTTHQGTEAAECCKLMAHIIIHGIQNNNNNNNDVKIFLENAIKSFKSKVYSIQCLANAEQEKANDTNKDLKLEDRNWRWKDTEYHYAPGRSREMPGYVGSYAMDALAMALHCVYSTGSLQEAMLKCANMRGDADTTTAITGQIAGAFYGVNMIPWDWIDTVLKWDPKRWILLRAWKLFVAGCGKEKNNNDNNNVAGNVEEEKEVEEHNNNKNENDSQEEEEEEEEGEEIKNENLSQDEDEDEHDEEKSQGIKMETDVQQQNQSHHS